MTKRAVSPLIATILLVGFAIAIGAIVSSFLIKQTQENFNPDVILKDTEFCDSVAIGYNYTLENWNAKDKGNNLKFLNGLNITNKGSYTITNVTIKFADMNKIDAPVPIDYTYTGKEIKILENGIKPGKSGEVRLLYNNSITKDDAIVEITPWVKDYTSKEKNIYIICTARKLKFNLYNLCKNLGSTSEPDNW